MVQDRRRCPEPMGVAEQEMTSVDPTLSVSEPAAAARALLRKKQRE